MESPYFERHTMYFEWANLDEEESLDELIEGLGNLSRDTLLMYVASIIYQAGFEIDEVNMVIEEADDSYYHSKDFEFKFDKED